MVNLLQDLFNDGPERRNDVVDKRVSNSSVTFFIFCKGVCVCHIQRTHFPMNQTLKQLHTLFRLIVVN